MAKRARRRLVWCIASACLLVAIVAAPAISARPVARAAASPCGLRGAKRLGSSRTLLVVRHNLDVYACLPHHSAFQLANLSGAQGTSEVCALAATRAAGGRYAGIDIHCIDNDLSLDYHVISSWDIRRRTLAHGFPDEGDDNARTGFVLAENGAIAWIDDNQPGAVVYADDTLADRKDQGSRVLDHASKSAAITRLSVKGNRVSWRHNGRLHSALLD